MQLNKLSNIWFSPAQHHKIWVLSWPMIISNISVPLLGLVDTAILGHLENALYLSAAAVGASILSFLYWGFGFLRMGTTGLTAQALGANRNIDSKLIVCRSLLLGLTIGLIIVALSPWILGFALSVVAPPEGAGEFALTYSSIRILSAPAVLINYAIIGWMIGRQNTRWPLLITVTTNALNILLDCLLIIGLGMKSEGAALATVVSEYSGCALALLVLKQQLKAISGELTVTDVSRWQDFRELLLVNRQLFVRTLLLLGSFAFFTAQGARQGDIILAANTLLLNLMLLTAFGLDGFAHAAEALVGDAVGKRDRLRFMSVCASCALWSIGTAMLFTFVFWASDGWIIALFTSLDAVQTSAKAYYPWLLALPLVAVWSYLLDGIFIGATQPRAMQGSMLFSVLLIYLPVWYFSRDWGNHGLWLAFLALNGARGISLGGCFWFRCRYGSWWPPATGQ